VGEQVVVLSPSGDMAQGVVIGSIYQQQYPATPSDKNIHRTQYSDGAVIEYNRNNHALRLVLPAGATVSLVSEGGVTIKGDVLVDGNIKSTKDITDKTRSMKADREIYNRHTHAGITRGLSTSDAPLPNQ